MDEKELAAYERGYNAGCMADLRRWSIEQAAFIKRYRDPEQIIAVAEKIYRHVAGDSRP